MASSSNSSSPASSIFYHDSAESVSPVKRGRRSSRRGRGRESRSGSVGRSRGAEGGMVEDVGTVIRGRGRRRGRGRLGTDQPAVHVESMAERKERIKLLVSEMTEASAKDTLCRVIDKQPGVMFDILDRITCDQHGYHPHPQPGSTTPEWCYCSNCREMPTVAE